MEQKKPNLPARKNQPSESQSAPPQSLPHQPANPIAPRNPPMDELISIMPVLPEAQAEQEGNAKYRQILTGAHQAFLSLGFDGASMNDIARMACVSKGTLYVYFPSKEALFEALITIERKQQAEQLFDLPDSDLPVAQVLQTLGEGFMQTLTTPTSIAQLRMVIGVAGKFPSIGQAFFETGPVYGWTKLAAWLETRCARGELSISNTRLAAQHFFELCQTDVLKPLLFGVTPQISANHIAEIVREAVTTFLARYQTKK